MKRANKYVKEIEEHQGYLDLKHWREAIRIAYIEGKESIVTLAEDFPNDQDLGEFIRSVSWKYTNKENDS